MKGSSRILNHIHLKVKDIDKSRDFYRSVVESLGRNITFEARDCFCVDELFVTESDLPSQSVHLAFLAEHPAAVKLFYETAIKHGGKCNGEPGPFQNRIGHFSAFVLDPDGNNIEAVFRGSTVSSDAWSHMTSNYF